MTNEELLSVAEIVERATNRFNAQAAYHRERFDEHVKLIASMKADHEAKMVEHRAAFGARTEADAKIIAGLREKVNVCEGECNVLRPLVVDAAKYKTERDHFYQREGIEQKRRMDAESERDGLLTQVQDMRAEMERLQWENATMRKDAEDGYAAAIMVLGDPIALSKERDALRAEVAALQERLRSSIARGDFAQMEVDCLKTLRPKYKVGDKLESYNLSLGLAIPVTVVGVRTVYDCQADGAEYPVGHSEAELKERYEQTPKQHPVKAGEWVRRTVASGTEPVGTMIQVKYSRTLHSEYVTRGGRVVPWAHCEPCDPPQTEPVPKLTHPAAVGGYLRRLTGFNTTPAGEVARVTLVDDDEPSQVEYEVVRPNGEKGRWSAKGCEPCDPPEADHDTVQGKATAEAALKTEPVPEEIKVDDLVEVVSNAGRNTWLADVGSFGTVTSIETIEDSLSVRLKAVPDKKNVCGGYVSICDVRKVTT